MVVQKRTLEKRITKPKVHKSGQTVKIIEKKAKIGRPKSKDVGGRPTVMTPTVIQKLEEAFSMGCTDLEACLFAGIGMATLYKYQNETPGFVERKEMLKESMVLLARKNIEISLKQGDTDSAKWYLERKKKGEFAVKAELEHTGGINIEWKEEKTYLNEA